MHLLHNIDILKICVSTPPQHQTKYVCAVIDNSDDLA